MLLFIPEPHVDKRGMLSRTFAEDVAIARVDAELAIPWPLPMTAMSEQDLAALPLTALAATPSVS